jgi:hypothetical protein
MKSSAAVGHRDTFHYYGKIIVFAIVTSNTYPHFPGQQLLHQAAFLFFERL